MPLREQVDCASFLPLRLIEQTGKPIHFASVGFQPAGQHLSATHSITPHLLSRLKQRSEVLRGLPCESNTLRYSDAIEGVADQA